MKFLFVSLVFIFLSACSHLNLGRTPSSVNDELTENELKLLKSRVEESLVWRMKTKKYYEHVLKYADGKKALPQAMQNELVIEFKAYLSQRERLFELVDRYKKYITNYKLQLSLKEPSAIISKKSKSVAARRNFPARKGASKTRRQVRDMPILRINPNDELGQLYIKRLKISLAATLVLYDNFLVGVVPYAEYTILRDKVNQDVLDIRGELDYVEDSYVSRENRRLTSKAILLFEKEQKYRKKMKYKEVDPSVEYLNLLITSSPSYKTLRKVPFLDPYKSRAKKRKKQRFDHYRAFKKESTNLISKVFGNFMGLFESRKGKLYRNGRLTQKVQSELKPLDILLEKTPFRLTDKFIPGHWGHAAIWVGTEAELKEIKSDGKSVWDSIDELGEEKAKQIKADVRAGKMVLEALRPGVMLNTLDHFMNIDDLGVMRRSAENKMSEEEMYKFLMNGFQQVGKEYDFNFDVNTDDTIVCSELIYKVYSDEDWPTEEALNRWTISPDNVADQSVQDFGGVYRYDVPVLYSAGREISGDSEEKRQTMMKLLKDSYEAINAFILKKSKSKMSRLISSEK